jgi:glycosyltransferase involved in cell wall biosynthesis|tara:strand:+ start:2181 stop:3128 length:948 start_codon:yes stop_codon:yes gene_type:complete
MSLPRVTFGVVNCNRLFYLKSCLESLIHCTEDYENKEFILIDNASIEEGTEEYLQEKEKQGIKVIRQEKRDPANEFAKALNMIVREATGDYICPVQGDIQFTVKNGWLEDYVKLYEKYDDIGSISFDAQRNVRNAGGMFSNLIGDSEFKFVYNFKKYPVSGAGDVMFSKQVLEMMYPWEEENEKFEGGPDSETKMLQKVNQILERTNKRLWQVMPMYPIASVIYTDPRGTNARIRGNKRYGKYWPPKEDYRYYKIIDYEDALEKIKNRTIPVGIEDAAQGAGWDPPVDECGNWKKNPIRPETAVKSDYVDLNKIY